ncbi:hypothetical protein EHQ53_05500 [Leptospira langatensis]|uniref:ATP-grasp domain-containing protein n=1 Tax=Leptospira langatensis TaxID=2484983 RepID=A0A5F1ZTU6_9LEPT|nr:hypothetical protein [Leptospira langatensis]TGK02921.1 hypothetical protein EHO57_06335 [Leptospira langatensis]TGL41676.1 hypothetical protein EHQ53_05500 [Leptospira langatensis]
MPRIFRPNAYFEEEIRSGKLFPKHLEKRNSMIEAALLVLAGLRQNTEIILSHSIPDKEWISFWKKKEVRIQKPLLLSEIRDLKFPSSEEVILEEWGRISEYRASYGLELDPKRLDQARRLSSKLSQSDWHSKLEPEFFSISIRNRLDWEQFRKQEKARFDPKTRYVFKPEWSFAGGHKIVPSSQIEEMAESLFMKKEPFLLETWVERTKDFSLLFRAEERRFESEAGTILLSDPNGKYSGTWIGESPEIQDYLSGMEDILLHLQDFASEYEGFGSIDSFFFQKEEKNILRKVSEVNFRWTMGRLLLELRKSSPKKKMSDLLLFFPQVKHSDPYGELEIWGKETGWEILPLSPFHSRSGDLSPKNLLWFRLPENPGVSPWEMAKMASDQGLDRL